MKLISCIVWVGNEFFNELEGEPGFLLNVPYIFCKHDPFMAHGHDNVEKCNGNRWTPLLMLERRLLVRDRGMSSSRLAWNREFRSENYLFCGSGSVFLTHLYADTGSLETGSPEAKSRMRKISFLRIRIRIQYSLIMRIYDKIRTRLLRIQSENESHPCLALSTFISKKPTPLDPHCKLSGGRFFKNMFV